MSYGRSSSTTTPMFVRLGSTSESDGCATGAVELQVGTVVALHDEPHRESPPCFEILQHDEVGQRFFRVEVVAVRRRERVAPLVEHFEPVLLAACADEGIAEVVDPRPRCRRDPAFERLEVVGCRIAGSTWNTKWRRASTDSPSRTFHSWLRAGTHR